MNECERAVENADASPHLLRDLAEISRLLDMVVTSPGDKPMIVLNLARAKATASMLQERFSAIGTAAARTLGDEPSASHEPASRR